MPRFIITIAVDCDSLSHADDTASAMTEDLQDGDPTILRVHLDNDAPRQDWHDA